METAFHVTELRDNGTIKNDIDTGKENLHKAIDTQRLRVEIALNQGELA
jgi:hypothetical protein